MASTKREIVRMRSSESKHFYSTVKNKTNTPGRMEFKKYDPTIRKHVIYKQDK